MTTTTDLVLIARDFDYSDPERPVLDVIRGGMRERLVFRSLQEARLAHERLLANGAEYLDAHEDGQHWRWNAATRTVQAVAS